MTWNEAKRIKPGDKIQHMFIKDCVATALSPAMIVTPGTYHWQIEVDIATTHRVGNKYYITGKRGYCWKPV